jgi:hypothetical protein
MKYIKRKEKNVSKTSREEMDVGSKKKERKKDEEEENEENYSAPDSTHNSIAAYIHLVDLPYWRLLVVVPLRLLAVVHVHCFG